MQDAEKWRLSDDEDGSPRYLEDVMYAFGLKCDYEQ